MELAKVVGTVVSTRKDESLVGLRFLVLQVERPDGNQADGQQVVAVDILGAGIGETVLFVRGGAARVGLPDPAPVDVRIVGIVDTVDVSG